MGVKVYVFPLGDMEETGRSDACIPSFVYSQDDLKFMRIRTKRHEIMISPGMLVSFASIRNVLDRCQQMSDIYLSSCMTQPRPSDSLSHKVF